jgi:hypothetical protein
MVVTATGAPDPTPPFGMCLAVVAGGGGLW